MQTGHLLLTRFVLRCFLWTRRLRVNEQSAMPMISTIVDIYIYIKRHSISICNFLYSESCINSQGKRRTGS